MLFLIEDDENMALLCFIFTQNINCGDMIFHFSYIRVCIWSECDKGWNDEYGADETS